MDPGRDMRRGSLLLPSGESLPVCAKIHAMGEDADHPGTSFRRETKKGEKATITVWFLSSFRSSSLDRFGVCFQGTSNANDAENNNDRSKPSLRDAESGVTSRHNGQLKLTMSTISASVAPSRYSVNETTTATATASGSRSGSGSGSGSGTGNATPNTTSTTLSRRHPSEDTTLDYAYDNPAMTPSPEVVQHRTKRESSF